MKQRFEFLLKCTMCFNTQKYATDSMFLENKRKICVYCGTSFKAKDNIVQAPSSKIFG